MRFKLKFKLYINSVIALVTLKLSIGSKKITKILYEIIYIVLWL